MHAIRALRVHYNETPFYARILLILTALPSWVPGVMTEKVWGGRLPFGDNVCAEELPLPPGANPKDIAYAVPALSPLRWKGADSVGWWPHSQGKTFLRHAPALTTTGAWREVRQVASTMAHPTHSTASPLRRNGYKCVTLTSRGRLPGSQEKDATLALLAGEAAVR